MQRQRGLTLLELLVVLTIIGLSVVGVSLSLRDTRQTQLEREAQRLIAVLEAARAQSRTSGVALVWQATPQGFVIRSGNAVMMRTETWHNAGTQATVTTPATAMNNTAAQGLVVLGPEPVLAPARITLTAPSSRGAPQPSPLLHIGTNGLQPFQVIP